jgi:hypothetical protein
MNPMTEHKTIWLQPWCDDCKNPDGRQWCEDNVWGKCECGRPAVKYVLDEPTEVKARMGRP